MLVNTAATGKAYRVELDKPHQEYRTSKGELVAGASTISGLFPKYLHNWVAKSERELVLEALSDAVAARTGPDGSGLASGLTGEVRARLGKAYAHQMILERSGRIGTIAHVMINAWLEGGTFDAAGLAADEVLEADGGFQRFTKWYDAEGYCPVMCEKQFVNERPYVFDKNGEPVFYGGTLDHIAKAKDGSLDLLDFKSGNGIYDNHKIQVAGGYRLGCEDVLGMHVSRVRIVRMGHGPGDMNPKKDVLDMDMKSQAWAGRAFLACLNLWRELKAN